MITNNEEWLSNVLSFFMRNSKFEDPDFLIGYCIQNKPASYEKKLSQEALDGCRDKEWFIEIENNHNAAIA